jgi:hypothetical protein
MSSAARTPKSNSCSAVRSWNQEGSGPLNAAPDNTLVFARERLVTAGSRYRLIPLLFNKIG